MQNYFHIAIYVVSADDIRRLYKRFLYLDRDGNGTIEVEEFLANENISKNPLAARIISIFDTDGSGSVDFREFLTGLSFFSSRGGKTDKLGCMLYVKLRVYFFAVVFRIYDLDGDGFISNGELFAVLKTMTGDNLDDIKLQVFKYIVFFII